MHGWTAVPQRTQRNAIGANAVGDADLKCDHTFTDMSRIILLISLITSSAVHAQSGFQNTYGGDGSQFGLSCQQTNDGGFVFFGQSHMGPGLLDMFLVRTDAWGNELWTKTYETTTADFGTSVKQMDDGGFILCGSIGYDQDSLAVIRTDPAGEILWQRNFMGWGRSVGQHVIITNDGHILVTGFTGSGEQEDVMLVRLTFDGEMVWTRIHDRPGRQFTRRLVETDDGGFAYFGTTGGFSGDMLLVRTDQNGDTLWTKVIGTAVAEQGMALATTADGGFVLLGHEYFPGGDLILMKADPNGEIDWTEFHGGDGWDLAADVVATPDGAYAIAGRTETNDGHHMYFIRTDASGLSVWENTYPRNDMSDAYELQMTSDGGYIMTGTATVFSPLSSDLYGVKIDASGYVSIPELQADHSILAFPNPFSDHTRIKITGHDHLVRDFILKDALGKNIRMYKNTGPEGFIVYREGLNSGIYFLGSYDGISQVHLKLIVQ